MQKNIKCDPWLMLLFLFACNAPESTHSSTEDSDEDLEVISMIDNLYCGTGGLSIGPDSNIYLSDFGPWLSGTPVLNPKNRVYKLSPEGELTILATIFDGASGSKFDSQGNFYQSNVKKGYITRISSEGKIDTVVLAGQKAPVGISVDKDDNLYINNCGANLIQKMTLEGDTHVFCQDTLLKCPNGITRDEQGNFYVSNFNDGNVLKITPEGKASLLATIPGKNNGHLLYYDNYLYVVARSAQQIYKVSLSGDMEVFAGSGKRGRKNGSRLEASFSFPNDLDISPDGKYMYVNEVADTVSDHRVLTPTSVRRILMPD